MFAIQMRTSTKVIPVVRVEPTPNLLPELPRSLVDIAACVAAGDLSLVSAEWAEGWEELDDFPEPGPLL